MTTKNVPSDQFADLKRDIEDATRYSNSNTPFTNRVGKSIRPIPLQAQDIADNIAASEAAIGNSGFIPKGDFATGGTVEAKNETFSDGSDYWRYDGSLPFTVTAGSSPTPTGVGAWINVTDGTLRSQLAAVGSSVIIGGSEAGNLASLFVDPRDFGVVPDDGNVYTAEMQAAFDTGKTVLLPHGRVRVDDELIVKTPGQQIIGHGGGSISGDGTELVGAKSVIYVDKADSLPRYIKTRRQVKSNIAASAIKKCSISIATQVGWAFVCIIAL